MAHLAVLIVVLTIVAQTNGQTGPFPPDFIWAVATSAYQVEGGWNANGKGVSNWDAFVHKPNNGIRDHSTGDVACDSYHKWQTDLELIRNLSVTHYRFSFAWTRLFPDGTNKTINRDGVDYYNNLINGLLAINVTPMVTLFHWDTPQTLEDLGGWESPDSPQWFYDYANFCFKTFGDRVKMWITFNEPWVTSWLGYGTGGNAPGKKDVCYGVYTVTHNIIKSHARAYRLYDQQYRSTQNGKVGITFNCDFKMAGSNSTADIAAADRGVQFQLGWFAHAIFVNGDYPQVMKDQIASHSKVLGINTTRLPIFTDEEKNFINGSSDFFGINAYTTQLTFAQDKSSLECSYDNDQDIFTNYSASWNSSGSDWLKYTPFGIRNLLNFIKNNFGNTKPIIITENGWSDRSGTLDDSERVQFYKDYITNVYLAYSQDGVNVRGYTSWALMDNFEWASGYTEKFGLHYVNFSDPSRPRIPKQSAFYYRDIILNNTKNAITNNTTPTPSTATTFHSSTSTTLQLVTFALFVAKIVLY
uniref:Uncharacterized protein n=1 Tax=Plectus sambesii TaxID=2011161 RepID=A0A914X7K2_9BILA